MASSDEKEWSEWSKLALALAAMILLGGVWIGVPLLTAFKLIQPDLAAGDIDYQPMMAVLIAMTTVTISGIFIFMTFRIDRGTRLRAREEVQKAAESVVEDTKGRLDTMEGRSENRLDAMEEQWIANREDQQKELRLEQEDALARTREDIRAILDEGTARESVRQAVRERITEDALRSHVEAVLMVDANTRLVADYARQRAAALDPETATALIALLNETIRSLRGQAGRSGSPDGFLARAKRTVARWVRVIGRRRG